MLHTITNAGKHTIDYWIDPPSLLPTMGDLKDANKNKLRTNERKSDLILEINLGNTVIVLVYENHLKSIPASCLCDQ